MTKEEYIDQLYEYESACPSPFHQMTKRKVVATKEGNNKP